MTVTSQNPGYAEIAAVPFANFSTPLQDKHKEKMKRKHGSKQNSIFVAGMHLATNEDMLRDHFAVYVIPFFFFRSPRSHKHVSLTATIPGPHASILIRYGKVINTHLVKDPQGKSRGFGFVVYSNDDKYPHRTHTLLRCHLAPLQ
jgi:RNA recognition motif-containing protein